jgi:DNA invertase Pin-like site-specific DNA recombinase
MARPRRQKSDRLPAFLQPISRISSSNPSTSISETKAGCRQYDASSAYIRSQAHAGWTLIKARYDDGGYSGGSTDRPDLQRLLDDIRAGKIDVIVVYKVDRLTRSLADFAKLVELFDAHGVSFVSVTQQFNTTTSMGRLTLNVLLSQAAIVLTRISACEFRRIGPQSGVRNENPHLLKIRDIGLILDPDSWPSAMRGGRSSRLRSERDLGS